MAKRRRTPKHPGVTLIRPNPERRIGWRARYTDPDTSKATWETLEPTLSTSEARERWAVKKSRALSERRLALEGGAPRATGTALSEAVDTYFRDHPQLRGSTRTLYRAIADRFVTWAGTVGVRAADDLTRERLVAFRASRLRVKLRAPLATKPGYKAKRGARQETEKTRAPSTINVELRAVRAILSYLRRLGLVARLSTDDLHDGLTPLDAPKERLDTVKPADLRKLLGAALAHDADTFTLTREEHDGKREPGSTVRHETPIAPFVAFVLLTGMRLDEALTLTWEQVDLDGEGTIRLTTTTKTHKPRDVGLEVSPALRALLEAMNPDGDREGSVFALTRSESRAAERRLRGTYGAPAAFGWQVLRQTCGSYLTNAPGIFGSASAWRSAKQLGHGVQVAEKHYVGLVRGIPLDARTLEAAMQIEAQLAGVTAAIGARPRAPSVAVARAG